MKSLALGFLFLASFANAQESVTSVSTPSNKEQKKNEIVVSSSSAGLSGYSSTTYRSTNLQFELGYHRSLSAWLQVGGTLSAGHLSYQYSDEPNYSHDSTNFTLEVGPTFNFDTSAGLENAYFVRTLLGYSYYRDDNLRYQSGDSHGTLRAGKRFVLFENVALAPYAYLTTRYNSDSGAVYSYGLQFLSASVVW